MKIGSKSRLFIIYSLVGFAIESILQKDTYNVFKEFNFGNIGHVQGG